MVGYAIWVIKCPQHVHEVNGSSIQAFHRKFNCGLFIGHIDLQQVGAIWYSSYDGFRS